MLPRNRLVLCAVMLGLVAAGKWLHIYVHCRHEGLEEREFRLLLFFPFSLLTFAQVLADHSSHPPVPRRDGHRQTGYTVYYVVQVFDTMSGR